MDNKAAYKLYLVDGNAKKTISESHPKLTGVTTEQWEALGSELEARLGYGLDHANVQSETTVYIAS